MARNRQGFEESIDETNNLTSFSNFNITNSHS